MRQEQHRGGRAKEDRHWSSTVCLCLSGTIEGLRLGVQRSLFAIKFSKVWVERHAVTCVGGGGGGGASLSD